MGAHGFRLLDDGLKWAKHLDYLTKSYSSNKISEIDYTKWLRYAQTMLMKYTSPECYKFPTSTEEEGSGSSS